MYYFLPYAQVHPILKICQLSELLAQQLKL